MAIIKEVQTEEEEEEFLEVEEENFMTIEEQERFFARNVALERAKYEPTAKEKIFSVMKAMALRAAVIFFLFWVFRRNTNMVPAAKSEL